MDIGDVKENLEFRKVQITGKSSYIVSLPKSWIMNNKIKKGDTLTIIEEEEGELRIAKVLETKKREKPIPKIVMDGLSDSELITTVLGNYAMGVDGLEIVSEKDMDIAKKKVALEAIRSLVGFEVISESPNSIKVKNLLEPSDFNLDEVINRLALISTSMLKNATSAIVDLNPEKVKEIEAQDDEVDRLYLLTQRLLAVGLRDRVTARKIGLDSNGAAMGWSTIIRSIERVADASTEIAQQVEILVKFKIPSEVLNLHSKFNKEIASLTNDVLMAGSQKDPKAALEALRKLEKLSKLREDIRRTEMEKLTEPKVLLSLETVNNALREVIDNTRDILKVLINSEYWQNYKK
ncbi:MAG: phosphate uptake regulator PhoU [Candidatus Freyarchaeota archaeon]|nr:phosphate uptake regulator PhoU [Candidatus Jordarchaeia archaeon]MBS7281049.1 phosphate uptake regulator PhoU [Candidatus Jordarchaeia archaeon]